MVLEPGGGGQNFREFEVDEAESAEGLGVGHVSRFGILVLDAVEIFQFLKKGVGFPGGDQRGGRAAVGGDQGEGFGIVAEEAGDVGSATVFEGLEDRDFVGKSLVGIGATELFVDVTTKVDVDAGADAVFEFLHGVGEGRFVAKTIQVKFRGFAFPVEGIGGYDVARCRENWFQDSDG